MTGFTHLLALGFFYSIIWFVPVTINYNRRKAGLAPYWLLFIAALVLEFVVVLTVYNALGGGGRNIYMAYLPPVTASLSAGLFYFYLAKMLDRKSIGYPD